MPERSRRASIIPFLRRRDLIALKKILTDAFFSFFVFIIPRNSPADTVAYCEHQTKCYGHDSLANFTYESSD